jgi:hypothetical protein
MSRRTLDENEFLDVLARCPCSLEQSGLFRAFTEEVCGGGTSLRARREAVVKDAAESVADEEPKKKGEKKGK